MKITMLAMATMALSAQAGEQTEAQVAYKTLKATYAIYSGQLEEKQAPTHQGRKLAIEITGPAARSVFNSLYPDAKVRCSDTKGEVWCIHQPPNLYRCFLGFNLRTGGSC